MYGTLSYYLPPSFIVAKTYQRFSPSSLVAMDA